MSPSKGAEGKLKVPKDYRPKKAKSWHNVTLGKPSPGILTKSPGPGETTPVSPQAVSLGINDSKTEKIELR